MAISGPKALPAVPTTDLDRLKNMSTASPQAEKQRLRAATKEFESFFLYYMLKTMRQTVKETPLAENTGFGQSLGKDMFTDMFDMEVARKVSANDSRSIGEMLYRSLEKIIDARNAEENPKPDFVPVKTEPANSHELSPRPIPIPEKDEKFIEKKDQTGGLPVDTGRRVNREDPIMSRFGRYIYEAAAETKLDSALIASVIQAESGGDPNAVSPAGAKGLMQLMDSTASEVGVSDTLNPRLNIRGGSRYLRRMLDRFGDLELALAAYNAGPGNVDRYGGVPPFPETQAYIERVSSNLEGKSGPGHMTHSKE